MQELSCTVSLGIKGCSNNVPSCCVCTARAGLRNQVLCLFQKAQSGKGAGNERRWHTAHWHWQWDPRPGASSMCAVRQVACEKAAVG